MDNWFTPGNWTPSVPTGADATTINTATPNPTVIDGAPAASGALGIGTSGATTGNLTIQNGRALTVNGAADVAGTNTGSSGNILVTGSGSSLATSGELGLRGTSLGAGSRATMLVENGGSVTSGNTFLFFGNSASVSVGSARVR